jgi:3-methylcrotonyl-CoA carboxylase alpha subunit
VTDTVIVRLGNEVHRVVVDGDRARVDDQPSRWSVVHEGGPVYRVSDGARIRTAFVAAVDDRRLVFLDGEVYDLQVATEDEGPRQPTRAVVDQLAAPMPAKVTSILVAVGQAVRRGEVVLTLEAMKMELPIHAPRDGTVRAVACREGELVQPGVVLVELA